MKLCILLVIIGLARWAWLIIVPMPYRFRKHVVLRGCVAWRASVPARKHARSKLGAFVLAMMLWAQPCLGSPAEQETQTASFIARRDFSAGINPTSVAVGDFNGDGQQDLAVANVGSNNVSVLLGNGDGTFQAAQNFGAGFSPVSVGVAGA